jgi:4-nitrophenyl phosphatase
MTFLTEIDNLILDMDGVLWRGETPMPGLGAFFETLQDLDVNYVLATNNATKVATQYSEKLARFGVEVPPRKILTSAEATAAHLREEYPAGVSAYVVGEEGLQQAMREQGFDLLEAEGFVGAESRTELVVVGFTRHVCYSQLASAAHLIVNGARFVGTNPDPSFPSEVGPLPGAGALLSFIQTGTGVEPLVIGKPGRAIFEEAMRRLGGSPQNTAMVGDRLETDIKGAQATGLYTILLLSGVTGVEKVEGHERQPDLICQDIKELSGYLQEARQSAQVPK